MLIYCDICFVIYWIEGQGSFRVRAIHYLAVHATAGDRFAFSDLVRLECRTHPMQAGDAIALAEYDTAFASQLFQRVPITTAVFDRATVIRATYGFKLADALHLAAAVEGGSDCFLTNDHRLSRFADLTVEVLP